MKHAEKEHLKENEVAEALAVATDAFAKNRSQVLTIGAGLVALVLAVGAFALWTRSKDNTVSGLLAEAMVAYDAPVQAPIAPDPGSNASPTQMPGTYPTERAKLEAALPKFTTAADASPDSAPGRLARLHAASILVTLGRFDEARTQYERLASGTDIVARGAALGKAQAQLRAGQFDAAAETLKPLSTATVGSMPVEGVMMELARAYRGAGKLDDARKTLNEIVEKHADSPFAAEARAELDKIKS